jgi:hypothetical protein
MTIRPGTSAVSPGAARQLTTPEFSVFREAINGLLAPLASECRSIDLLPIDIDGYWVLEAIEAVQPRELILEYNSIFGPDRSRTIPYDPAFSRSKGKPATSACRSKLLKNSLPERAICRSAAAAPRSMLFPRLLG